MLKRESYLVGHGRHDRAMGCTHKMLAGRVPNLLVWTFIRHILENVQALAHNYVTALPAGHQQIKFRTDTGRGIHLMSQESHIAGSVGFLRRPEVFFSPFPTRTCLATGRLPLLPTRKDIVHANTTCIRKTGDFFFGWCNVKISILQAWPVLKTLTIYISAIVICSGIGHARKKLDTGKKQ